MTEHIHTHKKEGILSLETIRMDLQGIMLSEISQRKRHTRDLIHVDFNPLSQTKQIKKSQSTQIQRTHCQLSEVEWGKWMKVVQRFKFMVLTILYYIFESYVDLKSSPHKEKTLTRCGN